MHHAVYNSRIAGMLTLLSSPLVRSLLPVLVMLLNVMAYAQNWAGAEEQLAGKIVSTTGPRTMAVEVSNRSSLSTASADEIRRPELRICAWVLPDAQGGVGAARERRLDLRPA